MPSDRRVSGALREKFKRIRMIIMDVDGVLTDGRIIFDNAGGELKVFDVHDGFGIERAQKYGLLFGLISGRKSNALARRAEELKISEVHQSAKDKLRILERLKVKYKLKDTEMCYIGDDEPDLPALRIVGCSAAPCNAMMEIQSAVDYVTTAAAGRGAVREVIDRVLRAKGII